MKDCNHTKVRYCFASPEGINEADIRRFEYICVHSTSLDSRRIDNLTHRDLEMSSNKPHLK